MIPHARVNSVTGTPTRAYSPNPIRAPRASAFSATIRFAIEPMSSRLPENVELIATTRHTSSGCGRWGTVARHRITAGTFEMRFESVAITALTAGAARHGEPLSTNPSACRAIHATAPACRSEEHTSELQSRSDLVCRLLLEKKKKN